MGLNLCGFGRLLGVGLLLGLLTACGGGSGGGDSFTGGGFVGREEIKVNISAGQTTLPPSTNTFVPFPNPASDPYTTAITVTVTQEDRLFNLTDDSVLSVSITGGLNHGSLVCPEVTGEESPCTNFEEVDIGDGETEEVAVNQFRYRAIASDADDGPPVFLNSGVFTFYFIAEGDPDGTAIITASVFDPNTNQNVSDSVQIRVTQGISTGDPAQIFFNPASPPPLYIIGQGLTESLPFRISVVDDALEPVDNPGGRNNLLLQILPNSPNGGETLSVIDADGVTRTGQTVATRTLNGLAQATITSGALPGTVAISATADRFDNNVDNGIQNAVTDIYTVTISNGQVRSLTFTGPFVEIIADNENVLAPSSAGQLGTTITDPDTGEVIGFIGPDNIYTIPVTVLAIDEFGNPPPPNTPITFRIVDSPLVGYPESGRGEFAIQGEDGNIQEGGVLFTTPPNGSTFAGAQPNCQLVYEGLPPDQEGGRIIASVNTLRQLTVNTPFNPAPDTGFTVPWVVGCPPHAGSVGQIGTGRAVAFTDAEGTASIDLIYDATQLGRRFKLVAEAAGGQAGAVLSYWYLGVGNAVLTLLDADGEFIFQSPNTLGVLVPPGTSADAEFIARLTDSNGLPLPAQLLSIDASVFDPDAARVAELEGALTAAENELQVAQANLDAFEEEFGDVCGEVVGPIVGASCPYDPLTEAGPSEISCCQEDPNTARTCETPPPSPPLTGPFIIQTNTLLGQACSFELSQSDIFVCSEADSFECTTFGPVGQELQQAVFDAQQTVTQVGAELAAAQALDDEFDPTVFVNVGNGLVEIPDDGPVTVLTGANGEAPIEIVVSGLPPRRVIGVDEEGNQTLGEIPRVSVFITTVGPDPQAPAIRIDFQTASDPVEEEN